jgi:hypothetical protein
MAHSTPGTAITCVTCGSESREDEGDDGASSDSTVLALVAAAASRRPRPHGGVLSGCGEGGLEDPRRHLLEPCPGLVPVREEEAADLLVAPAGMALRAAMCTMPNSDVMGTPSLYPTLRSISEVARWWKGSEMHIVSSTSNRTASRGATLPIALQAMAMECWLQGRKKGEDRVILN